MDSLNFVIGLNKRTGVEIPEADYPKLQQLRAPWTTCGLTGRVTG